MSEGSRLSRWSQRKLAARHGGALPDPAELTTEKSRPVDERLPSSRDPQELAKQMPAGDAVSAKEPSAGNDADPAKAEKLLTEADLPSIERLTAQSDYTVFLKKNVPEALRRRALRKLWVSDPVLANLDGLNDYDDDYTIVTAMTMNDTSYKLGRGLLGDDEPNPELDSEISPDTEAAPKPAQTGDVSTESEADIGSEASESRAALDEPSVADGSEVEADGNGNSVAPPDAERAVGAVESDEKRNSGTTSEKYRADTAT